MAYFWVNQNKTYRHERDGQFLWAPKLDEGGNSQHHWTTMTEVQPGDVIFSYVNQTIKAVSTAKTSASDAQQPASFTGKIWDDDGWRVDVQFEELSRPLVISDIIEELRPTLPSKYSPLNRNDGGNQGYLFPLPPAAGHILLSILDRQALETDEPDAEADLSSAIRKLDLPETQRLALVNSRIGQGPFRDNLLTYWSGKCAVTGLSEPKLLTASHIKPWRDSNNEERLDLHNGLLLSPSYDALFDKGFISFNEDGNVILSSAINEEEYEKAGIKTHATLLKLDAKHHPYLRYHQEHILL